VRILQFDTLNILGRAFATAILNLRPRLAWRGSAVTAAGCWGLTNYSWAHETAHRATDRTDSSSRICDHSRNTSARRLMDTRLGIAGCSTCPLEHYFTTWRSMGLHLHGNHRCRLGTVGTWRLVSWCPTLWMEAHRGSRSKEL